VAKIVADGHQQPGKKIDTSRETGDKHEQFTKKQDP
jgi:hypothetical protein